MNATTADEHCGSNAGPSQRSGPFLEEPAQVQVGQANSHIATRPPARPSEQEQRIDTGMKTCMREAETDRARHQDACCGGGLAATNSSAATNNGCCDEKSRHVSAPGPRQAEKPPKPLDCSSSSECNLSTSEPDERAAGCHEDDKSPVPSCCEGKASPCCDAACLDRLALRECENGKPLDQAADQGLSEAISASSATGRSCHRARDGSPCGPHARSVRGSYAVRLQALGCICRALLALGQESCCAPRERPSSSLVDARRCSRRATSPRRAAVDTCCSPAEAVSGRFGQVKKGCCNAAAAAIPAVPETDCDAVSTGRCCDRPDDPPPGSVSDPCFAEDDPGEGTGTHVTPGAPGALGASSAPAAAADLERGPEGTSREPVQHVILSISGMTCTGCETKLSRTLAGLESVQNLKTSLVLGRAEFDLPGGHSLEDVVRHLHRTTEFSCERIADRGSSLDVIAPCAPAEFITQPWPDGVTDMTIVVGDGGGAAVRVAFDPSVVGARDLVEKGWGTRLGLAAAHRLDPSLDAGRRHIRHVGYITLLSAALTIPVLVMAWAPLPKHHEIAYGSVSLALATVVQLAVAGPFYPNALKSLIFSRVVEMDLLIVLSTSAAFIFSVVSFGFLVAARPLSTGQFFETSTLLVTLIMVGRYLSALARHKAVESISSVRSLQVPAVVLVGGPAEPERELDVRLLQYGDVFKVAPDSRIPTDGTVISGSSDVDESMITGEAGPVEKRAGSGVVAGSINGSGVLVVRLTRLPADNTVSIIAAMVDEAKLAKPRIQHMADRVASWFVPAVIALAMITLAAWVGVGIGARNQSGSEAVIRAVTYAISVLIVSCPCAIGLAVPMVMVIASGVAAEKGVIFKSADSIEVVYRASHVVFDKTGTLTQGKLAVVREEYPDEGVDRSAVRSLLLGLVGSVKHPVSAAVAAHLGAQAVPAAAVADATTLAGRGVEGTCAASGRILRAGNSRWLGLSSDPRVQAALSQGYTVFCFVIDGSPAAVLALEDTVRPDAGRTVAALRERGVSVHVLSGDDDGAVRSVTARLSILDANVRSRCTPADKQAYVRGLVEGSRAGAGLGAGGERERGRANKRPVVIFCGDGTNDAAALAQATVGVHMSEGGTDVARSAADVVLMSPSLGGILTVMAISRIAVGRIRFNFGWSLVYNLAAILLAAGALGRARIPPEYAGLGELVSVLPVVAAAVLVRWSRI